MMVFTAVSGKIPSVYHLRADCGSIAGNPYVSEDSLVELKECYPTIRACRRCCR